MDQAVGSSKNGNEYRPGAFSAAGFQDFDQMTAALQSWELSFLPLESGPMRAELAELRFGHTALLACSLGRGVVQEGGLPAGCRTIGIPLKGCSPFRWHGQPVDDGVIMIFPRGGELDSRSQAGFQVVTLSVPENLIAEAADREDYGWVLEKTAHVVRPTQILLERVRTRALSLLQHARSGGQLDSGCLDVIEFDLLNDALAALASGAQDPRRPMAVERNRVLRHARELIEARVGEPLQVSELVESARCSARTLRYAFEEEMGVSPKMYLKSRRLLELRRRLLSAGTGMTVSEVAAELGYSHLGQLAADYRGMFGELPSATLRDRGTV